MNEVVSHAEWLEAREQLLEQEKELTRLSDELARLRRALPWERVEKRYRFHGPEGEETLADLFAGRSQLIVYHFMFDPGWDEGCKSCSLMGDSCDRSIVHLEQRDVTMVWASRAPLEKLEAFKRRLGWGFKWVSTAGDDFNHDFRVSFSRGQAEYEYNYGELEGFPGPELPGISVFVRGDGGEVFHTYSAYARGLDSFLGVYRLLDIVPKGRDEDELPYGMAWLRLRDSY